MLQQMWTSLSLALLQHGEAASSGTVGSQAPAPTGSSSATSSDPLGGMSFFIIIGVMILIFYIFIIRPQRKQQKDLRNKIGSVAKGDRILTMAGFHMKVASVREHSVIALLGEGRENSIRVEVGKNYIQNVFKDGTFENESTRDSSDTAEDTKNDKE